MDNQTETQDPPIRFTPANAVNHRQEMKPLPLRVASAQYQRLCKARDRSGISIQEHIRRGIDDYLAKIEREAIELGLMPSDPPNNLSSPKSVPARARSPKSDPRPKVEKR